MRLLTSCVLLLALCGIARADDQWSDPLPGVRLLHRTTGDQNINVLTVDLCAPGVSVRATGGDERGRTVQSFGELTGVDAAVNGDFFGGGFSTDGIAVHGGAQWSGSDHTYTAPLAFGTRPVSYTHLRAHE